MTIVYIVAAVIVIGFLVSLAPDLVRYIKIRSM
jgi:hypothetical protein